jgi:hypothetical protein
MRTSRGSCETDATGAGVEPVETTFVQQQPATMAGKTSETMTR